MRSVSQYKFISPVYVSRAGPFHEVMGTQVLLELPLFLGFQRVENSSGDTLGGLA